jgi:hypothetical protein
MLASIGVGIKCVGCWGNVIAALKTLWIPRKKGGKRTRGQIQGWNFADWVRFFYERVGGWEGLISQNACKQRGLSGFERLQKFSKKLLQRFRPLIEYLSLRDTSERLAEAG